MELLRIKGVGVTLFRGLFVNLKIMRTTLFLSQYPSSVLIPKMKLHMNLTVRCSACLCCSASTLKY